MLGKYSVKKPYTVIVGVILILVLGVISFTHMTTDLLPSMKLSDMRGGKVACLQASKSLRDRQS
mgnify:CR=1 FL=1